MGRHALGLHHNGMLDLGRSVKLRQLVATSPGRRAWRCFRLGEGAARGLPLRAPGAEGPADPKGAEVRNNGVDGEGAPGRAGGTASAVARSGTAPGEQTGVVPARDRLFTRSDASDDACVADPRARAHVQAGEQPGLVRDAGEAGGDAGGREYGGSSEGGRAGQDRGGAEDGLRSGLRTSWCFPTADADGLRVVLFGLEQAVLARPALAYW